MLKVRTTVFTLSKQNLKLLRLLYSFFLATGYLQMFIKKSSSRERTGKLHLRRPLESRDLEFAYLTQLNLQKITRAHVLRAGLPVTSHANKNATDINKQGF